VEDWAKMAEIGLMLDQYNKSDVYVRVTPLLRKLPYGRGKKGDTAGSNVLWIDRDVASTEIKETVLSRLKKFDPAPTMIVDSGGGFHAYWQLRAFVTDLDAIVSRNKWLAQRLGGDSCWDITRVLRIPGTYNRKHQDNVRLVALVHSDPEAIFELDRFGTANLEAAESVDFELDEEPLPENFLVSLPEVLRKRITTGEGAPVKEDGTIDRSKNDYGVIHDLLKLGYTLGQCMTVLLHPEWVSGEKARVTGPSYARITVAACSQHHSEEVATSKAKQLLLDPVIEAHLFVTDPKTGARRKMPILKGSEFVNICAEYLQTKEYRFCRHAEQPQGYIVTNEGDVITMDRSKTSDYHHWVYGVSGFTDEEKEHRILQAGLESHAINKGIPVKVVPWCHLVPGQHVFYLLLDKRGRKVLRVGPVDKPKVVLNCTDGVLLRKSQIPRDRVDIQWDPDVDLNSGLKKFVELFHQQLAVEPWARSLLTCYALALPLARGVNVQTLPVLHLTGPSGGGKSQTLRMLSAWLHGDGVVLVQTTAASYRSAASEILLPLDDVENMDQEQQQFILVGSTDASRQKSGGGTEDIVQQHAHLSVAITSINPFEGIAMRRRAFVVEVNHRLYPVEGFTELHWKQFIEHRSLLWSAYARWMHVDILPALHAVNLDAQARQVEGMIEAAEYKGLASFLSLMWTIGTRLNKRVQIFPPGEGQFENVMRGWLTVLKVDDAEEQESRNPILRGIRLLFDAVARGEHRDGWVTQFSANTPPSGIEKMTISTFLGKDWKLRVRYSHEDVAQAEWVALEGTATAWEETIRANMRTFDTTMKGSRFGQHFSNMVMPKPVFVPGQKEASPVPVSGLLFVRVKNLGAQKNDLGWRVIQALR